MFRQVAPFLPALLIAYSGFFGGTLDAVSGRQVLLFHVVLLAGLCLTPALEVPRSWHLAVLAAMGVFACSLAASEVPRAGQTALVFLPAFAILPFLVARLWSTEEARRRGLSALAWVVAGAAAWSIWSFWLRATPGASLPLGHHNLLATWLLALLPLALDFDDAPLRSKLVASLGGLALVLTFSRAALIVCLIVFGLPWLWLRLHKRALVALALMVLSGVGYLIWLFGSWSWPQALGPSTWARWTYLEAALVGFLEKPWLGHGPGSTAWLSSRYLPPIPGLHPPSHLVPDWHSLPAQVLFELGLVGFLALLLGAVVGYRRLRALPVLDPSLWRRARLALVSVGLFSLTGLPWVVLALPIALAVVVGALLCACERSSQRSRFRFVWPPAVLALASIFLPHDLAQLSYDRALAAENRGMALFHLDRAVNLDPRFPLYRWQRARFLDDESSRLGELKAAAEGAKGVGVFWLSYGLSAAASRPDEARAALILACDLDPLAPLAPYRLAALGGKNDRDGLAWAARAFLAEPLLIFASRLEHRQVRQAADLLRAEPTLPLHWRAEFERSVRRAEAGGDKKVSGRLRLEVDQDSAEALSLRLFRRQPWPLIIGEEAVALVEAFGTVGKATVDPMISPQIFERPGCRLGLTPER